MQGEALSLAHSFFVPPLKVRKDWYEGLNPDPTDHSHPDVGNIADAQALEDNEVNLPHICIFPPAVSEIYLPPLKLDALLPINCGVGNHLQCQPVQDLRCVQDLRDLSKRVQFRGTQQQQQQQQQTTTQAANDAISQQKSAQRHLLSDASQDADAV